MDARTGAAADQPATWLVVVGPDQSAPGRVLVQAGRLALITPDGDDDSAPPSAPSFNPAAFADPGALLEAISATLDGPLTEAEQAILGLAVSRSRPDSSPRVRPHEGLAWDHPGMTPPDGSRS